MYLEVFLDSPCRGGSTIELCNLAEACYCLSRKSEPPSDVYETLTAFTFTADAPFTLSTISSLEFSGKKCHVPGMCFAATSGTTLLTYSKRAHGRGTTGDGRTLGWAKTQDQVHAPSRQ